VSASVRQWVKAWILSFADVRSIAALARLPRYFRQMYAYRSASSGERIALADAYPCLNDASGDTPFDPHYFFQGAWLARQLAAQRPALHVDVGSSIMTVSAISAIAPTVFVDYRPLRAALQGLYSVAADLRNLPFSEATISSLSCLHVIEHVGLGRYGDALDPAGPLKAARELERVLAPKGRLYLSTPVGRARVCFNAHRVFAADAIPRWFTKMRLLSFSLVDDNGTLHVDGDAQLANENEYGCGLFVMEKDAL
jgi:SAM-dependent methyltransferase